MSTHLPLLIACVVLLNAPADGDLGERTAGGAATPQAAAQAPTQAPAQAQKPAPPIQYVDTPTGRWMVHAGRPAHLGQRATHDPRTEGFIDVRKNLDIAGRPGEGHLFIVDQKDTRYIDCAAVDLQYGRLLVDDALNCTETAMPQEHCYLAMELVLEAQPQAQLLTFRA